MSLADLLTILRLILVPFFLIAFLKADYLIAFILFSIAGFTDLVDGTIARLLKTQTKLGAFLDPVADKALMVTTVTSLLLIHVIPLWFFLLVVIRDAMILGGLGYCRIKKIQVQLKPVLSSKLATLSNIIMVVFGFLAFLYPQTLFFTKSLHFWFRLFLGSSTLLIMISGLEYGLAGLRLCQNRN